jgi:hypothetical protein
MISGIDSARLKSSRALEHYRAADTILRNYLYSEPDAISKTPEGDYEFHFSADPPAELAIIVGEFFYQLRSALDHVAFDLVNQNRDKVVLPEGWVHKCRFPLITEIPKTGDPPVPAHIPLTYNAFEDTLPGISKETFAFVESVQPYHQRDSVGGLRFVEALAKIDGHRYIRLTKPHTMPPYNGFEMKAGCPFVSFDESAIGPNASHLRMEAVMEKSANSVSVVIGQASTLISQ